MLKTSWILFFRVDCEISGFFYRCDQFVFVFVCVTLKSVNLRLIREFFMVFTVEIAVGVLFYIPALIPTVVFT